MSGQSKNGNSVAYIPRRSARGKTLRESTTTSEPQVEDVNSAASKVSPQPHRLRKSDVLSFEIDVPQLEDNNPRRSGRKNPNRLSVRTQSSSCLIEDPLRFITTPTTVSDLEAWKGWCEVESEPVCHFHTPQLLILYSISHIQRFPNTARPPRGICNSNTSFRHFSM